MIRVGIVGYGNLGRGVELAIRRLYDIELVGIFTRRDPASIGASIGIPVYSVDRLKEMQDEIDVLILCGGSATDLPVQTPEYAEYYNVVDSFDTHAKINEHFENVNKVASASKKTAIISVGWDPGTFSLNRAYARAILSSGEDQTFWGEGVSQGHSDAIRRIEGVENARQYTIPKKQAIEAVRNGDNPSLTARDKHMRECFVVLKEGADAARVEEEIKTMPNYFAEYDTTVHFISAEELQRDHMGMPHGGFVICTGRTGENYEHKQSIEYQLNLESNPEFTACILVAYARAAYNMNQKGQYGCKTVFDVPPAELFAISGKELRAKYL